MRRREEELARSAQNAAAQSGGATGGATSRAGHEGPDQHGGGFLSSALTNIVVIVGFAAFAYTVKYVLRSIVE